jgi:signal peptide peptidase SppA
MKPIPSVLAAPWAVDPSWLHTAFQVWGRGNLDVSGLNEARTAWQSRMASAPRLDVPGEVVAGTGDALRIMGSVGVVGVDGALFRHANLMQEFSGGTTYDSLWRAVAEAEKNDQVKSILLRVNSPGGEADGVSELAKAIRAASKPVWAYCDNLCASAGYWLASQAQVIVAEEAAEIGSIGVRCGLVDTDGADEMAGVKRIEIVSSQSPNKRSRPIDEALLSRVQVRIDDMADRFVEAVAAGRRISTAKVLEDFGQGDCLSAGKALRAGMVDGLGNFNSTLKAMENLGR